MIPIGLILLASCSHASDDASVTVQAPTTIAEEAVALPSDQIYALVDSYVASALQSRPEILVSTNMDDLKTCTRRAATELGNSVLQSFTTLSTVVNTNQSSLARTAVMQSIQQNLEPFIAKCSTK